MTEARPPKRRILTISVPAGGHIAGNLGRSASYGAVHKDDLPIIKLGRLFRVLVVPLELKLGVPPCTIEQMLADDPVLAAMAGVTIDIGDSGDAEVVARGKPPARSGQRRGRTLVAMSGAALGAPQTAPSRRPRRVKQAEVTAAEHSAAAPAVLSPPPRRTGGEADAAGAVP